MKNTGRSNDGAPPLWVHGNGFTPQHRTAVRPQHNPDSSSTSLFFFWRGSASEDQTYRWPPVTHHHYISAHYHHIPEVTLSRGNERRTGKRGGGTLLFVTWSQLGKRGALPCPKCWAWQHTYREGAYDGNNQNQYSVVWLYCYKLYVCCLRQPFKIWFKNSCKLNI